MSEYTRPQPQPGEIWRHYKGGEYRIVALGLMEADLEPVVIYTGVKETPNWVRPLERFMDEMVGLEPRTYRFERIG